MGLEVGGGTKEENRRRRRKFPCVKAYVIDPFGATAQKGTNRPTDRRTDKAGYRVAATRLKVSPD